MSDINKTLQEKIEEYENKIADLEKKMQEGSEEDKRKHDFELADLKSKLGIAQQELKDKWGEGKEGSEDVSERIYTSRNRKDETNQGSDDNEAN